MKIHYVYAGHPGMVERQSPYSITRELFNYLKARCDVRYSDWCTMGLPDLGPDDIILGHPHYDPNTIVQRAIREAKCKLKCMIFPLHHGEPEHNLPFHDLVMKSDKVFSIMGPYWYDTLDQSPFASWKPKITRLDMAIDASQFPFLRTRFNPPGQRNFLYLGHARPWKNVDLLYEIMRRIPQHQLWWYGGIKEHPLADLPNVHLSGWVDLNPAMARTIVDNCDFFLNCSKSDANPTTLLESAAWGIVPACTRQSGYYPGQQCDWIFDELSLHDMDANLATIQKLQHTPEAELLARARASRQVIEQKYTWKRFCGTIWNELQPYIR
jgi:glycosyltransferase involved in cell wall biosynthesis